MTLQLQRRRFVGTFAAALAFTSFVGTASAQDDQTSSLRNGKIFISSNAVAANQVLVYSRPTGGTPTLISSINTGGNGTGAGLGSQGAVTLSRSGRYLFVVVRWQCGRLSQRRRRADTPGRRPAQPVASRRHGPWPGQLQSHACITAGDAVCEPACPLAGPEQRAMQAEFLRALAHQLQQLPPKQTQAFLQSECAGQASAEVCAAMGITEGHLWVLVHRARSRLRLRLAQHR